MQFTNGADHKSANKAAVQLDPFGWYDMKFKTHIVIVGGYLVVLLAHYTYPNDIDRTGKYQPGYLVDWVKGHVIHVRTPLATFELFFEFPTSLIEMAG
jgi:hypothetical protein